MLSLYVKASMIKNSQNGLSVSSVVLPPSPFLTSTQRKPCVVTSATGSYFPPVLIYAYFSA